MNSGGPCMVLGQTVEPIGSTIDLNNTQTHTVNHLHHRVTEVQHRPNKCNDSAEHLLAELCQLSLNTLTQKIKN